MKAESDTVTGQRFCDVLRGHNHGLAEHEATKKLSEVVRAIRETGGAGSVTIKISLEPIKNNVNQLLVVAKVTESIPTRQNADVRFSDDNGTLTEADPKQLQMRYEDPRQSAE